VVADFALAVALDEVEENVSDVDFDCSEHDLVVLGEGWWEVRVGG
jgi:hypothetical protein